MDEQKKPDLSIVDGEGCGTASGKVFEGSPSETQSEPDETVPDSSAGEFSEPDTGAKESIDPSRPRPIDIRVHQGFVNLKVQDFGELAAVLNAAEIKPNGKRNAARRAKIHQVLPFQEPITGQVKLHVLAELRG